MTLASGRRGDMELAPSDHQFLVLAPLYQWMGSVGREHAKGVLVDFGCGAQPYRRLLEPGLSEYLGADLEAGPGIELDLLLGPDGHLPLEDRSCDTVLSNQVLEHVADPLAYLAEACRVLRPGGKLILTVPMQWRHHELPRDYWRFTRPGIEHLVAQAGFDLLRIDPAGGAFAVMGQVLLGHLAETRQLAWPRLFRLLNRVFAWLDGFSPDPGETLNWQLVAVRRESEA